jgi:hypothetical protein
MTGGRVRSVRLNVTLPAGDLNSAVVRLVKVRVPSWNGLPQPGGGFPLPSDNGCVARQKTPSILAHSMPQCVYRPYDWPRCVTFESQPATRTTNDSTSPARILIHPHYAPTTLPSQPMANSRLQADSLCPTATARTRSLLCLRDW